MIYCFSLANQLGIDIASAIDDKIEKNGIKYPDNAITGDKILCEES